MGDAYITRRGGGGKNLSALVSQVRQGATGGYSTNRDMIVYAGRYALVNSGATSSVFVDVETGTKVTGGSAVSRAQVFDSGIIYSSGRSLYLADPATMTVTKVYDGGTSGSSITQIVPIPGGVLFLDDDTWLRKYVYGNSSASLVDSGTFDSITAILNGYVITGEGEGGYWYNCDTEQCVYMGTTYVAAVEAGGKILYGSQTSNVYGLWMLDPETNEYEKRLNTGTWHPRRSIPFGDKFIVSGYGAAVFDPDTNSVEVICSTPNGNQLGNCIAYNFDGDILISHGKSLYAYDDENKALGDALITTQDSYLFNNSYTYSVRQVPGTGWMIIWSFASELALYKSNTKTAQLVEIMENNCRIIEAQGGCLLYSNSSSSPGLSFFDDSLLTVTNVNGGFSASSIEYGRTGGYILLSSDGSTTLYLFDSNTKQLSSIYYGLTDYGSYLNIGEGILLCAYRDDVKITPDLDTYNIYRPLYFDARLKMVFDLGAVVHALSAGGANDEDYIYVKKEG